MTDLAEVLGVATDAARAGGDVALAGAGDLGYLSWKGPRDALLGRALTVQQAIVSVIQRRFPDHAILKEEGPDDEEMPVEADPLWIVDPICGSINYLIHDPHYAIGIGYREAGFWQVGVVYEPARGDLYTGVRGARAHLNGQPIRTDQFADGTEAIERAVVGIDWPATDAARREMSLVVNVLSNQVLGLRAFGSPALGVCAVAAGRLHGYVTLGLKLWDLAPASVILQAAGGVVTDGLGAAWMHSPDGSCIASNATIHGRLITSFGPLNALRRMNLAPQS
ncbi:MAG TPA: inositol monophosphatase family protein [Chloroflexota bacterium]